MISVNYKVIEPKKVGKKEKIKIIQKKMNDEQVVDYEFCFDEDGRCHPMEVYYPKNSEQYIYRMKKIKELTERDDKEERKEKLIKLNKKQKQREDNILLKSKLEELSILKLNELKYDRMDMAGIFDNNEELAVFYDNLKNNTEENEI
jgi:hypothetical protein